jgi:dolichyl-diphosphooligosaccharide--protein glycosyltransferase
MHTLARETIVFPTQELAARMRPFARGLRTLWPLALLVCLAFALRWLPFRACFLSDEIRYLGTDTYDHMRRVFLLVEHFPWVHSMDFYLGYPEGAPNLWPPLFHLLLSSVSLVLGGGDPSAHTVETVGAVAPTVFGALCLVPVYYLGRGVFGRFAGLTAAAALAVLPAHLEQTMLGCPDNNGLEPLLAAALFLAAACALPSRLDASDPGSVRSFVKPGLLIGLTGWVALFTWRGSTMILGIVALYAFLEILVGIGLRRSPRWACLPFGIAFVAVAAATAPFVVLGTWGARPVLRFSVISWFHVLSFTGVGAILIAAALAPTRVVGSRALRLATFAACAASLLVFTLWLASPGLLGKEGAQLHRLLLAGGAVWGVSEYTGLAWQEGALSWSAPSGQLGWAYWTTPVILVAFATREVRAGLERPRRTLFVVWAAVLFCMSVPRTRFAPHAALAVALTLGVLAEAIFRVLSHRLRWRNVSSSLPGLALVALLLLPAFSQLPQLARGQFAVPVTADLFPALRWMRENTPATSHYMEPWQRPEYGVLAQWDFGHWISYLARRPAVATPWGDEIYGLEPQARFFLTEEPAEAERILEENRIRYVIVTNVLRYLGEFAKILGLPQDSYFKEVTRPDGRVIDVVGDAYPRLVSTRLYLNDGMPLRGPRDSPAVECMRLIYESRGLKKIIGLSGPVSRVKIYERVRGAILRGEATPRAVVRAEVELVTNQQRRLLWRTTTRASPVGRYRLRLPYATEDTSGAVRSLGPYRVLIEGRETRVVVDEAAVLQGSVLTP